MIKFVWFGTATVLLDVDGEKLLFDPYFRINKKLEPTALEEFCHADYILNTHPHFDHLCDWPKILPHTDAKLIAPPTALLRLEAQDVDVAKRMEIVCPHDTLNLKNCQIKVHRTRHVKNNAGIILKTAFRILFKAKIKSAIKILSIHKNFKMGGDIVAYEINCQQKTILLFGSAGFDESTKLPKKVDVLIWPFQGRTGMTKYSLPIIEKINPKKIVLDHFDDAFPPITGKVDTRKFVKFLKTKHPEIEVIVPKFKQQLEF